jgi:hypothetical protein
MKKLILFLLMGCANLIGQQPAPPTLTQICVDGNCPSTLSLQIVTTFVSPSYLGTPYVTGFQATGGVGPYSWSATGLPSGLAIRTVTGSQTVGGTPPTTEAVQEGQVYGTPAAAGTYNITITVTDSAMNVATLLVAKLNVQSTPLRERK